MPSAASADAQFCANTPVNNVQRCFGAPRNTTTVEAAGATTGVCVGVFGLAGPCAPTGAWAYFHGGFGNTSPWVQGTGANLTYAYAVAGMF
jgi:hypothetical protein